MKKEHAFRGVIYVVGLIILAFALSLNSSLGLGIFPITTIGFTISELSPISFANANLFYYLVFIAIQLLIHLKMKVQKRILIFDICQLPMSLIFTRFMGLFKAILPNMATLGTDHFFGTMGGRILLLAVAVILTGIGASMSIDMRLVPHPGDGTVQAISDFTHIKLGLTKNIFDICCCIACIAISYFWSGHIVGIGIGTIIAMFGTGRVISVFNKLFLDRLATNAGMRFEA